MKSNERNVSPVSEYYIYTPSKTAQSIFLYPIQCGIFTYEPGYTLKRASFNSFLLFYLQSGSMWLEENGRKREIRKGAVVLLDCYDAHSYGSDKGADCVWLHFDGRMARDYYDHIVSRLGNVIRIDDASQIIRRMNDILRVFQTRQAIREPLMSKRIIDILTELMLFQPDQTLARCSEDMVLKTVTYIHEHFEEELSVSLLASRAGLSTFHFSRIFRKETGYTPHEYLINHRMASARYLLSSTGLTIKEICFKTGYSNESIFCNAFKKNHGMTPQQYRLSGTGAGSAPREEGEQP